MEHIPNNCLDIAKLKGFDHRYTKDCIIRQIRGLSYETAKQLIGWTGDPPIVIQAGIGTLVLGPDKEDFTPAPTVRQKAKSWLKSFEDRTAASEEEQVRRRTACQSCEFNNLKTDSCTACGCGLKAKTRLQAQKCPKGRW